MNIKQYMREGKSAMDVLFKEEQSDEGQSGTVTFKYYDELPLPKGHIITYTNPENGLSNEYMVDRVISQEGSCSITYLMKGSTINDWKVMKEFRPRYHGIRRCMIKDVKGNSAVFEETNKDGEKGVAYQDYQLDYDTKDDKIGMAKEKFEREPERVKLLDTNSPGLDNQARAKHLPRFHSYCFEFHGNLYYLLDYVEGSSLFEYVRSKGKSITWEQKVSIMEQLCTALNHLHKECVHMDVTPYNIMVNEEKNGNIYLTLIDFGLATSIAHNPNWGSLHDQGTSCFTDTTSYSQLYKKIHDINKQPAPILVVDIYSVGMIWLYLLNAHMFENVDKGTMQVLMMDTIKRNVGTDKKNAKPEWLKQSLELACDSISYDNTRISDEAFAADCYGPFWQRPKTIEDWYGRLAVINKGKEPYIRFGCSSPLEMPANDKDKEVELTFETNGDWVAQCDAQWLKGWKSDGREGKQVFQLKAVPNLQERLLGTKIIVTATVDGKKEVGELPVVQPGCGIEMEPKPTLNFPASGGTGVLRFKAGSGCKVSVKCQNSEWLENEGMTTDKNGWQVIQLKAVDNTDTNMQYADVCINCCGNEKIVQLVQDGYSNSPSTDDNVKFKQGPNICFESAKDTHRLFFEATGPWNAYIENNPQWVKVLDTNGNGSGMVRLEVKENTSISTRDEVKLVIALDNGNTRDFVLLSQKGSTHIPFDWKALWQKVRIPVCALGVAVLAWGGYSLWWSLKPALQLQDEPHKTLAHNATGARWDFDAKDTWTAEVVDGAWVTVGQSEGDAGSHHLSVQFNGNRVWAERTATIRLTCQDKSELLTIRQGYDRVDSLNHVLTGYRERYEKGQADGYNDIFMRLDKTDYRGVFRNVDGSYIGNNTYVIQGKNKDCRIGDTHKVVDFKQNAESLFTEIIVAPINE